MLLRQGSSRCSVWLCGLAIRAARFGRIFGQAILACLEWPLDKRPARFLMQILSCIAFVSPGRLLNRRISEQCQSVVLDFAADLFLFRRASDRNRERKAQGQLRSKEGSHNIDWMKSCMIFPLKNYSERPDKVFSTSAEGK